MRTILVVVLLLVCCAGCATPPPIYVQGVVANVNIAHGYTWVTIIPDGSITPSAYALEGIHPEFWQREWVGIQISLQGGGRTSYGLLSFRRIGADK